MKPNFFGLHANISHWTKIWLSIPVFVLVFLAYFIVSGQRHAENPDDKLFPTFTQMGQSIKAYTTEPESMRKPTPPLWADTASSLKLIGWGVLLSFVVSLLVGLNMGMFRAADAMLNPFITIASSIPPVAIMPILLIAFGKDDLGKVMMIFFGLVFAMIQTIRLATKDVPREQIIKSETLGASTLGIVYRVVLPQVMPKAIDAIRINIGLAWIFLIVSEFISANQGLGYRIFLVRRYLDMSVILPYVAWITILGFTMMLALQYVNKYGFPWYNHGK